MTSVQITLLGGFSVSVDGVAVDAEHWARRHAAGLVKILALSRDRRLHREQVIDMLWPDDTLEQAGPKLHKAAHFARRAIDVPQSIVLRGELVLLCPAADVTVDVDEFEELEQAARRSSGSSALALRRALALYRGDLLPEDPYEPWAEERRESLRLRHLDLLRLDEQWEKVIELDPTDERAHLGLMRRYASNGDRHAALRQFERMDRVMRRELGVAPGREATALRDRLLTTADSVPPVSTDLVGRAAELSIADTALIDASAGASRTLLVVGPAGMGKTSLLTAIKRRAKELGFRTGHGTSAPVEGAWPYAPVVEALADICRQHPALLDGLADHHRLEIDRALAGEESRWSGASSHQPLFVAAAELVRLAAAGTGLLLTIDDLHDADDGTLRLLHYVARATRGERVAIVLAHRPVPVGPTLAETRQSLIDRHGAIELVLAPLDDEATDQLIRRHLGEPTAEQVERIVALSGRIPFTVNEMARRAATEPRWVQALDANMIGGVPAATRQLLQRVAVVGATFDTDEFVALSGLPEEEAFDHLDIALDALVIEPTGSGYRFRHGLVRDALLEDLPPHRRRRVHRDAATRLIELQASAARIGHHLLHAGASREAVPYLLRAADTAAASGAYRDALSLVESILPHATGAERTTALGLRADLLNAVGDPLAIAAYREAIDEAGPGDVRRLRVRLARCALMSGDIDTTEAALDGLEPDGGEDDADIFLTRGKSAFFTADIELAKQTTDAAQRLVLSGERNWKVLDLVALQGMLAHLSGQWFDRMRVELRATRENPEVANAVFDGYLCPAEYVLYGPTPYAEVIEVAGDIRATASRSGALRAAAFASAVIGEAALLSGDLVRARTELIEAIELHRDVGSSAGQALSMQRLAEVELLEGDRPSAVRLLQQALPLARASMIGKHLLQRIFGTMIMAAADLMEARAIVDRAELTLGWDDSCPFCSVMLSVPATIACARAGDLLEAQRHLDLAEESAALWEGTSWEAAINEARAEVAIALGDADRARNRLQRAIELFGRAGQPLDVERCRRTLLGIEEPAPAAHA